MFKKGWIYRQNLFSFEFLVRYTYRTKCLLISLCFICFALWNIFNEVKHRWNIQILHTKKDLKAYRLSEQVEVRVYTWNFVIASLEKFPIASSGHDFQAKLEYQSFQRFYFIPRTGRGFKCTIVFKKGNLPRDIPPKNVKNFQYFDN